MWLAEPSVFSALADHLTLADLMRLSRALGRTHHLPLDVLALMANRLDLSARQRATFTKTTMAKSITSRRRCLECGVTCRRTPRVCAPCARTHTNFRSMIDRAELRAIASSRRKSVRGVPLAWLRLLVVVKRDAVGRLFYWRREALAALADLYASTARLILHSFQCRDDLVEV